VRSCGFGRWPANAKAGAQAALAKPTVTHAEPDGSHCKLALDRFPGATLDVSVTDVVLQTNMTPEPTFDSLTDDQLLAEAQRLATDERRATAHLLLALIEVDARRLFLREGCSSLFTYCTQVLHSMRVLPITASRSRAQHGVSRRCSMWLVTVRSRSQPRASWRRI
jgi:hypothetical protein